MKVPNNYEIFKYWETWLGENKNINSKSFCCLACKDDHYNVHIPSRYNDSEDIKKIWNNLRGIQKHHIFPKQFEGNDNVDNLFLLCKRCHNNAPILRIFYEDKTLFLKWVKNQSFFEYFSNEIKENLKWICDSDLEKEIFEKWIDDKVQKSGLEIFRDAIKNSGLHRDTIIHRVKIPISSIFANLYFQWQKELKKKKRK